MGIPRKNLQTVGGQPLIAWTVRCAVSCPDIDIVIVSTDDPDIRCVAEECGATVYSRPEHLAGPKVPTDDVIVELVADVDCKNVIVAQCTSPLTTPEDISACVNILSHPVNDSVVSVCQDMGVWYEPSGEEPYRHAARRQDRKPKARFNGSVFGCKRSGLLATGHVLHGHIVPYWMPADRSIDIDTPLDLHLAEALLQWQKTWIVVGSSVNAPRDLRAATIRYPFAKSIAVNGSFQLFDWSMRPPAVYFVADHVACNLYGGDTHSMRKQGTKLVTLKRDRGALKTRGVDHFDEFLKSTQSDHFVRGSYADMGISGLWALQYAVNSGAKRIVLVGMEGYTGIAANDYWFHDAVDKPQRAQHTREIIGPFTQSIVSACPDVEFEFWGNLNYRVSGANVTYRTAHYEIDSPTLVAQT